jgi:hypothetical protein
MSFGPEPFPTSSRRLNVFEAGEAGILYCVSPAASFQASTSRIERERYHNALTTGSSVREKEEKRQSVRSEDRARTGLVTDAADGIFNVIGDGVVESSAKHTTGVTPPSTAITGGAPVS